MTVKSILFVCLGNICRSPAADGVMRQRATGMGIEIDSAGIGAWHVGQLPDQRMRRCGARHGYTFDHHARQVSRQDFERFDLIVGMDAANLGELHALAPDEAAEKKIVCLADYMSRHRQYTSIPDPYYGDDSDFELALELIEDGIDGLINTLAQQ